MPPAPLSIFLDFSLPNATTWFYFSFLLAVTFFFKFSRLFSVRNLDVLALFLLAPGLLLLQQAHTTRPLPGGRLPAHEAAALLAGLGGAGVAPVAVAAGSVALAPGLYAVREPSSPVWVPYLLLLIGSCCLLLRCLLDLVLVRRPALAPNLTLGGLAWLALALFVCLSVVAFRPPLGAGEPRAGGEPTRMLENGSEPIGQPTAALELAQSPLRTDFVLVRCVALLCHLSVVIGLILIGGLVYQDTAAGVAMATFYLLLPYTGYFVGQVHHVWPMALIVWAFLAYRRPTVAGLFLGLAAGTALFPALLLPLWTSFYWKRGAARFLLAWSLSAGLCLALTGWALWLSDDLSPILRDTLAQPDWQPWQWKAPTNESFWVGVHWAYRMPVFIVYLTLVLVTACWPYPKNLGHVMALSTAVLVGVQLWFTDQGGVYVLWYLPVLLLMMFRPNLADRRPPEPRPGGDWLRRGLAAGLRFARRLARSPRKLMRV